MKLHNMLIYLLLLAGIVGCSPITNEVIESYLPMSKKKARKFVIRYLDHKRIGNKIYVDRIKLEELLKREDVESFPLD